MENNVGVVGIGNMGIGIATNLLKANFNVHVYDIRPEPLEELKKKGAVVTSSLGELAQTCSVIFSVLLDFKQNLSVLEGPEGLLENMKAGSCIFVCSTLAPDQAKELAKLAEKKGVRLLDSPISGGSEGAMAGTLSIMIGGDEAAVEEHRNALEALSSNVYHFGDVGSGETAKSINQVLVAINNAATAEAMMLAAKAGLDLKKVFDLISNSAGNSWIFQHRAMRMIEGDFEPRGVLRILLKDTTIVKDTADSLDLVLPLANIAQQLYQAGVNNGWGDDDDSAVVKVLEKLANFQIG
jgi:3-hydroxyisobutyrate dehydrogenase-like beta-hydroxyacid dehydrogenase